MEVEVGRVNVICTESPSASPLLTSVTLPNTLPIFTSVVAVVVPVTLVTTVLESSVRMAAVGTVRTSG